MVVPIPQGISLRPLDIALQMNDDSLSIQEIVSLQWDLVEPVPGSPVPSWSPPISLKDAGELDSVVVEFCEKSTSLQSFNWPTFYEFIRLVWKKRLPLTSNEIWLLFEAHGASFKFKKFVVDFYQKGTELLIYVAGRKPIKKKRVQPLLAEN